MTKTRQAQEEYLAAAKATAEAEQAFFTQYRTELHRQSITWLLAELESVTWHLYRGVKPAETLADYRQQARLIRDEIVSRVEGGVTA